MDHYQFALEGFLKGVEQDETFKQAKALLHVALATEVCGLLFELLLDEGSRKNVTRKGCVALLKQADLHQLEMPRASQERADMCVRMDL